MERLYRRAQVSDRVIVLLGNCSAHRQSRLDRDSSCHKSFEDIILQESTVASVVLKYL